MASTYALCPRCHRVNRVSLDQAQGRVPVCGACKNELVLHGAVNEVNSSELQILTRSSPLPVVADFWASWCGPCRIFAPVFEAVSKEMLGRVVFASVNTETDPSIGAQFGIRGIPTIILFRGIREIARAPGASSREAFLNWLDGHLGSAAA